MRVQKIHIHSILSGVVDAIRHMTPCTESHPGHWEHSIEL